MVTRVSLQPAFVLHRRPYSNTSLIVELFTSQQGRISAIAKSARGPKSRYRGKLELFFPMLVSWQGMRELKTLGHMELAGMPCLVDGERLASAFYLNELLLRLLPREDPHPELFSYYQSTLNRLAFGEQLPVILRLFEKKLLDELGYGIPLDRDIETGGKLDADLFYEYIPDRGFSSNVISPQKAFAGKHLLSFRDENFDDALMLRDVKRLTQLALSRLLGDKPLSSRELLR